MDFKKRTVRKLNWKELDESEHDRHWYMRHHPVIGAHKFSVFLCNPPFKYKGESLKDKLLTEIDLMQNLLVITFGFRELQNAMTGDREAMFLLKKMPSQELRELRFLWRSKLEDKIGLY